MERGPEVLGGHPLQQCLHCNVHGKTKLTTTPNLCKKKQDGDARSLAGESHAMPSQTRCACTGLVESFVYGNCDFTVLLNMTLHCTYMLHVHVHPPLYMSITKHFASGESIFVCALFPSSCGPPRNLGFMFNGENW